MKNPFQTCFPAIHFPSLGKAMLVVTEPLSRNNVQSDSQTCFHFFPLFTQMTEFSTHRSQFLIESWNRLPDTGLQTLLWCQIGDRWCSVRQAIILAREAIGHFQESQPFCHMDPEDSEETRFLTLLGTIFKGKFLFLLQSISKTFQLVFMDCLCQMLASLTTWCWKRPKGS